MQRILAIAVWIALTSAVAVAEEPRRLKLLWEQATPKQLPQGLVCDASGRYLSVAMKNDGLVIFDVSPKAGPKQIAQLGTAAFGDLPVMHLTQRGDHLYLALGDFFDAAGAHAGLAVVHVKNPAQPRVTALWKSREKLRGSAVVLVDGTHAYLGAMTEGVFVFDISRPDRLQRLSAFQPDIHFPRKNPNKTQHPNARGLAIQGNRLYVAYDAGGLRVLDISDRRRPKEIGRYANAGMARKQEAFNNLVLDQGLAYVACDYAGLEILDVRDPANIRQVGWWNPWEANTLKNLWINSPGHTNQIVFDGKKKLAYLSAGGRELQVIDVSTPARPRLAAEFRDPDGKRGVWGLTLSGDRVYLSYITAVIPFQGTWAGIKAVAR